jgi:methylase of polypeptide subunit release factors
LAVLLRPFLLGVPVAAESLGRLVGANLYRALDRARLLVPDGDLVHGAARIVPHDELLIASDHSALGAAHADHVPGVHRPSVALAHLTVRGEGERVLDMGTGNGIQAILLSRHAKQVVATDVNARALEYAAFNTALNGATNVETRHGSFFDPVEGERFDLVVSNPPYVISPESAFLFRDSGMRGDAVSEHVVRAAPAALEPGAFATLLISWPLEEDDPAERPRRWLEGSGCDAFLLHTSTDDPVETASLWNRDLLSDPEAYSRALDRWLVYYRELGIDHLGYGALVLRKRADGGRGWLETLHLPRSALRPAGRHVRQLFETHDALLALGSDEALLDRRLRVAEGAVITQSGRFADGRWLVDEITLRLERGLPFSAELDATTSTIVRALDGSRTLRAALGTAEEASGDRAVQEVGLALTRQMLEVGFLELLE